MTTTTSKRTVIREVDGVTVVVVIDPAAFRELRTRYGMSLDAVAAICDCTKQNVHLWETGSMIPSGARIAALRAHFGSELDAAISCRKVLP